MSYKRISVRFNMDVDAERKAWEIIHEKGNGLVGKEVISAINTSSELSVLSKKAKKAGVSIDGFVRRSVADKEIREAPPADIPMLLRAMRQAGYNLDQTLKRFNTTNVPDMPQFRKDLEGIRAATKMVSDAYTSDYQ